jgi:bifunctional N-acetylglucosamine-1-phosphate-uridyltransferase/glucosamine-1-phosphate-acetyltransferase GlmU-like protein
MKSDLAKVLFPVLGRPMIHWVIDALEQAGVAKCIVVVGHQADDVKHTLAQRRDAQRKDVAFALQAEQLGTGHAVQMAIPALEDHHGPVVVVAGDSPLLQPVSVRGLLDRFADLSPSLLLGTLISERPEGLGRIVRGADGQFEAIVEHKDATEAQRLIGEVNMSTYVFGADDLRWALSQLRNNNQQREYYLTDCAAILRAHGKAVDALSILQPCESLSINTPEDLARVEVKMQEMGYRCAS